MFARRVQRRLRALRGHVSTSAMPHSEFLDFALTERGGSYSTFNGRSYQEVNGVFFATPVS